MNLMETPKKEKDAGINNNKIDQLEFFSDKVFEKQNLMD